MNVSTPSAKAAAQNHGGSILCPVGLLVAVLCGREARSSLTISSKTVTIGAGTEFSLSYFEDPFRDVRTTLSFFFFI